MPWPQTLEAMQAFLISLLSLLLAASEVHSQPTLFGLGESAEGSYQLDTSTIEIGGATRSAWVIVTQAPNSQAKKLGADFMLVMFMLNCSERTIGPIAWKARTANNQIIAEGVHGKEKRRTPVPDSMDERIFTTVCGWK